MTVGSLPVLQSSSSSLSLDDNTSKTHQAFFENVLMIYLRDQDYNFINKVIYRDIFDPTKFLSSLANSNSQVNNGFVYLNDINVSESVLFVWEKEDCNGIIGVVTKAIHLNPFNRWMVNLLMCSSRISFLDVYKCDNYKAYTKIIKEKFVEDLKFSPSNDKWTEGGSIYFEKKLNFFTSKGLPVEAVLPAFPCKSSNLNKVSSWQPDKGEELALRKLCDFARFVKSVYPPGMIIWVVSDGHVFSDCIGVDDKVVNKYGEELKKMYNSVQSGDEKLIKFCSLLDIFDLNEFPLDLRELEDISLDHYVSTELDETSEICRKLMMKSCDTDYGQLRKDISTPNHPRLSLYQGFNRFMIEDLEQHKSIVTLSGKRHKKIAKASAFEMIKRNDAYSNLVELIFPMHLRFSIHAHTNAGPKFGIKLLSSENCRPIKSLDECCAPNYEDLLHIPTPWHNSVFKYEREEGFFLVRSGVIRKAIEQRTHTGNWDDEEKCFHVERN